MTGINLSAFFAGASTAFYAFAAWFFLHRTDRTRWQSVLGWIMVLWTLLTLKDIVISFPQLYTTKVLNIIALVDGWSAVSYAVIVFEATMPGWTTSRRLLLLLLPFTAFTLVYCLWPCAGVITAYYVFLCLFALTIVGVGFVKAHQYIHYLHTNYSYTEHIDLTWMWWVFFFAIVSQLSWLAISIIANTYADTIYYISVVLMWLVVFHYTYHFRPVDMLSEPAPHPDDTEEWGNSIGDELDRVMDSEQLYMNSDLTLQDLAAAIGTNRTYLSRYLSQVRQITFYDYVNNLRLKEKSIPMMQQHPEYTLEYIAAMSGFKSISTFRRAFQKLTGQSPGSYYKSLDVK